MGKLFLFLMLVLTACGSNPDAVTKMAAPNEHVVGTDAGTETAVDYLDGKDGRDGVDGKDGAPGPQGQQGVPGETGPQGPQGIPGERGATGPQGATGFTGPQGSQGIPGMLGPQGLTGATGAQGPAGLKGADGAKGDTGLQGVAGPVGATGPQGPQGAAGVAGPAGADGVGGYWVDSMGARAPIVNSGGGPVNNTLYVDPQGFMYPVIPMTGRLTASRVTSDKVTRYFESTNCTGRSWIRFMEMEFISPMIVFPLDGALIPGYYTFSRAVKADYTYGYKAKDFPAKVGSQLVYVAGSPPKCAPGIIEWPAIVANVASSPLFFYYIEFNYLVGAPDPNTVTQPTAAPYRFVPNL